MNKRTGGLALLIIFVYILSMDLLPVILSMMAGILLADASFSVPVWAYGCAGILVLISIAAVRDRRVWTLLAAWTAFVAVIGVYHHRVSGSAGCADTIISSAEGRKVFISGWITGPVAEYADRDKIAVTIDTIQNDRDLGRGCRILITIYDRKDGSAVRGHAFVRGDYVRVRVLPKRPINYKNPGSFDYKKSLERKNIDLIAYVSKGSDLSVEPGMAVHGLLRTMEQTRAHIEKIIKKQVKDPDAFGIINALVIGDQGYISPGIRRSFASTGIVHILVVAGLHLAIITHLFYLLLKFFLSRSKYLCLNTSIPKLSLALSMIPMTAYIFLSGANPPVIRSGIMIAAYSFMFLAGRTPARWAGILAAAFIILMTDPASLFSISFQLSFIAVCSILSFMPAISRILAVFHGMKRSMAGRAVQYAAALFLVSLFVTIGLGGVIAFYFNSVPMFGIVLNVLAIPFFCYLVLPLSLLSSAAGFLFPSASHYLFFAASLLIHSGIHVIHGVSELPAASFRVPTPSLCELVLYYAFLVLLLNVKRLGTKKALVSASLLLLLFAGENSYRIYKVHTSKELSVTFLDVGQGDSAFIEFPGGETMLIDAGGGSYRSFDTGESIVARSIWSLKRTGVDTVVASHPQIDHIGGLGFIIRTMGVRAVYKNDCDPDTVVYRDLMESVRKSKTDLYTVIRPAVPVSIGGAKVEIFTVPHDRCDPVSNKGINNSALLTRITYGDISFLFTGDIEEDAERSLADTFPAYLKADVMKAPHHGSKTSDSERFIDAVGPSVAVISVGEGNPFHMPSKYVLKRLFDRGIRVLRTDRSGAIRITTDGKHINITNPKEEQKFLFSQTE